MAKQMEFIQNGMKMAKRKKKGNLKMINLMINGQNGIQMEQ